jgi:hypothetical protein
MEQTTQEQAPQKQDWKSVYVMHLTGKQLSHLITWSIIWAGIIAAGLYIAFVIVLFVFGAGTIAFGSFLGGVLQR